MNIRNPFASKWRASIAAQLSTLITQNQELIKLSTQANATISQVAAAVTQLQADFATLAQTESALAAKISAFIASVNSPSSTSVLSPADQATLDQLETEVPTLDTAVQGMNNALGAITIPAPATPPASTT